MKRISFSKPAYGWCRITFYPFNEKTETASEIPVKFNASYLTSIAREFLVAATNASECKLDLCLSLEGEEDGCMKIIADETKTLILMENYDHKVYEIEGLNRHKLTCSILEDIKTNQKDWILWTMDVDDYSEETATRVLDHLIKNVTYLMQIEVIDAEYAKTEANDARSK